MKFRFVHALFVPVLSLSILFTTTAATAQQVAPPAAVTPQAPSEQRALSLLMSAKTVSIVDPGEDENFPPADTNGARKFAAQLTSWGQYTVVPDGKVADVTLQVQGLTRAGYVPATDDSAGYRTYSPYFRLTIIDPKDGSALWNIAAPVISGRSHGEDLFEMSVRNLLSALKTFEGAPLTPQELKDVRYSDRQRTRSEWVGTGILVGVLGLAAGAAILGKHEFDKSVDDANAKQHQFCVQNHIPGC